METYDLQHTYAKIAAVLPSRFHAPLTVNIKIIFEIISHHLIQSLNAFARRFQHRLRIERMRRFLRFEVWEQLEESGN